MSPPTIWGREKKIVFRPRDGHEKKPALLCEVIAIFLKARAYKGGRRGNQCATPPCRIVALYNPGQVDRGKLQPFRLMNRHDLEGIGMTKLGGQAQTTIGAGANQLTSVSHKFGYLLLGISRPS